MKLMVDGLLSFTHFWHQEKKRKKRTDSLMSVCLPTCLSVALNVGWLETLIGDDIMIGASFADWWTFGKST